MDSRIPRTWFLKDEWSSESFNATERYHAILKSACKKTHACSIDAKIFLVDTPFTFGHSQLAIKFSGDECPDESSQFDLAASIIQKALFAFKQVLSCKTIQEFECLSKFTHTNNKNNCYIKTLVLRASAQEENGKEYKVHLVPYFASNAVDCKKWYDDQHCHHHKEPGGLLGWLGVKETEVERWKNHNKKNIDDIIKKDWKLPKLAKLLCQKWPSSG